MRRLILTFLALSLAIPATAQMRGMRAGGGIRISAGRGPIIRTVPPRGTFVGGRFGLNNHRFRNGFRNRFGCGFSNTFAFNTIPNSFCGGFGFNGFGFNNFGYGYGLPYYLGDYDSYSTGAYNADHVLRYREDDRASEIRDLMSEVRDQQREIDYLMNNQQGQQQGQRGGQDMAPQGAAGPRGSMLRRQMRPSADARPEHEQPPTTIIFKDGRRVDVHSYVIAKSTLTILDGGMRQRFQLSQVDIPATQKANEERGVEFKAPTATVSLMCAPGSLDISCRQHQATAETVVRR
jgi:hypothetical protein